MPPPPPPQLPLVSELESLRGGRQIFIDDINESKAVQGFAYSAPLVISDSRQVEKAAFASTDVPDILASFSANSTKLWNASDSDDDGKFWAIAINMQHLVFVAMCLCLVTLVLFVIVLLKLRHMYQRWRRRRRSGPRIAIIEAQTSSNAQTPQCIHNGRRGLLSRMLARIEEFDSLTPLIITPNSLSDDDHVPLPTAVANRHLSTDRISTNTSNTPISFRGSPRRRPRCAGGKITLFPLASNARRAEPYLITEASDSGDSIRGAYQNNVQARITVPATNGVVMRNPFEDLDLVSIDRTSGASTLDRLDRRHTPNDLLCPTSAPAPDSNAAATALSLSQIQMQPQQKSVGVGGSLMGDLYPLSTIPSPASTDVLIPVSELHSSTHNLNPISAASNNNNKPQRNPNGNNHYRFVIKRESSSVDSLNSNLSSPMDSSICGDTGSPLDTTGSLAELSDSVYMASESESSEMAKNGAGRIYSVETGSTQRWYSVSAPGGSGDSDKSEPDLSTFEFDTPALKRYVLHRIEEESVDDMAAAGTTATSSTPADRSKRSGMEQKSVSSKNERKPPNV